MGKSDSFPDTIDGLLLDLDGVVYVGDKALPGAREAIWKLRAANIPFRFITNTTRRSRAQLADKLARLDLEIAASDSFTPASLMRRIALSIRSWLSPVGTSSTRSTCS